MLKGKKSEYETSCICGIDESCTEMGMVAVPTVEGRKLALATTRKVRANENSSRVLVEHRGEHFEEL